MRHHALRIAPKELLRWLRAEGEGDFVNFHITGEYDRREPPAGGEENRPGTPLVESAQLHVEPLVERNYWVLTLKARRPLSDDAGERFAKESDTIDLEGFERLCAARDAQAEATVSVEDQNAEQHFESWLSALADKHDSGRAGARQRFYPG